MKRQFADYLLEKTRKDYNRMAPVWSSKRSYLTADILDLKKYTKAGDRILDLGCGNGRLFEMFEKENISFTGTDTSDELVNIAQAKYPKANFIKTDFLKLPFKKGEFDLIYCLSVFHHIPSEDYQLKMLSEIKRILKDDGTIVLTVWYLRSKWKIKLEILKNFLLKLFFLTKLDYGDIYYDFFDENKNLLAKRYIHCFSQKELENLFKKAKIKVVERGISLRSRKGKNENIYIIGGNNR